MAETYRKSKVLKYRDLIQQELHTQEEVLKRFNRLDEVNSTELANVEGIILGLKMALKTLTGMFDIQS